MISRLLLIASVAVAVCCLFLIFGWWILLLAIPLFKRNYKRYTAFGTARWADESDLDVNAKGLPIGRLSVPQRSFWAIFNPWVKSMDACKSFWGHRERPAIQIPTVHALIVAPTGVGKGVSFSIPHGLTCEESTIFLDFNGEIARATAGARRKMGHRVVLLDPFHVVTDVPDTFNPLDFIKGDSTLALDDSGALAESIVVKTGQEREPHWLEVSELNIAAITAFVVHHAPKEDRSLQTVRDILNNPDELEAAITVMRQSPAWSGMLARMGHQLTHFKDKELASTLTTTGRFLRFLDTLPIADSTKTSSFDPSDLLTSKLSVFLILPPEYFRVQSPLLRLWIGSLLRAITKGGLQNNRRVHVVLDEASCLGHLDCLDDAIDRYRKFGVRMILMYQSLGQLKKCWPDGGDQTLLSNTTQVYFGVNDQQTAEYISARLGEETIVIQSGGTSTGRSRQSSDHSNQGSTSYSVNSNDNWAQHNRKLLKPEEVLALDERTAITFTPGLPPIWTTLERYYENKRSWKWLAHAKMFFMCMVLFVITVVVAMGLLGMNIHQLMR
jgi:type IV secretion system protein VirD4